MAGYEALRAQARGQLPSLTPRGLAVFLRAGLVAWMCSCPPREPPGPARPAPAPRGGSPQLRAPAGASAELVQLLAEMAIQSQRRCSA